jgi:DNA mismatch endonuclease, patch repair protein
MSRIRSKDTKPEIVIRSIVHNLGFRFRLHSSKLPGKPDLVFPRHKKIILVNGCFWHMHDCKRGSVTPKTNTDYWQNKRFRNVARDTENEIYFRENGWNVLTVWECETKNESQVVEKLNNFFFKNTSR